MHKPGEGQSTFPRTNWTGKKAFLNAACLAVSGKEQNHGLHLLVLPDGQLAHFYNRGTYGQE